MLTTLAATSLLAAGGVAGVLAPSAGAAEGYRVSISVAPDPDVSGDPLTIVGTVANSHGMPVSGMHLVLYHRVNPAPRFTPIQRTRSGTDGVYQINRAEGVVISNREWYIVVQGPHGYPIARSRIVHERVYASLTLAASASSVEAGQPLTFSGTVSPRHVGENVILQRRTGEEGESWQRIGVARVGAGGSFSAVHRFRASSELGPATIRALFTGDARNIRAYSEPVEVTVEQAQNPQLTLAASTLEVVAGETVTLNGKLSSADSGSVAAQPVTLYAQTAHGPSEPVATATTGGEGEFAFTQTPAYNTAYVVKAGSVSSDAAFVGVHDTITAAANTSTGTVGEKIMISGVLAPGHPGHIVYLQYRNAAGHYQTIQVTRTTSESSYQLVHQLQSVGVKNYRVYVPGGPYNLGAASAPFEVTVTPATGLPNLEATPEAEPEGGGEA